MPSINMLEQTCASHRCTHYIVVCDRMCMNGKTHVHECERKHTRLHVHAHACKHSYSHRHTHVHICAHVQMHASLKDMNTLTHTCSGTLVFSEFV